MIDRAYVQRMARYNRWQNANLYGAAGALPDAERRRDMGAFFRSIHNTLNHLLWGDRIWMSRFAALPKPVGSIGESVSLHRDWDELKTARTEFDQTILSWADRVEPSWLTADETFYSQATRREWTRPRWLLVTHMFNHQTHHRGQVHCLLTQLGARPGDTDLPVMPD